MSEKTPRKRTVKAPAKQQIVDLSVDLIPTKTYRVMANGIGGMQKDMVYTVSGVVASALISKRMAKLID